MAPPLTTPGMQFNSFGFALFATLAFSGHWALARYGAKVQNIVLLASSALFCGLADIRSLALLLFSGIANHALAGGTGRAKREGTRRLLLWAGIALDLGLLGYFKYFGFFLSGFTDLLQACGLGVEHRTLDIILPLGISFYTFRMLGYLIAVHDGTTAPCKDPLAFLAYVLYFPILLAGPVERAERFLPQVLAQRVFETRMVVDGLRRILWGLVAKTVVADNAGEYVDLIFADPAAGSASTLLVGAFLYFIQIYCDFSGYSNIAIGVSALFGIRLMNNFATPFFATDVGDFWRRWHVSLTTWMIDHLFTPISFLLRDHGRLGLMAAITITFMAVGIWHGANWTFVVFGLLQSLYFLPQALDRSVSRGTLSMTGATPLTMGVAFRMVRTFLMMMFSFVLLRAADLDQAVTYLLGILHPSMLHPPRVFPTTVVASALLLLGVEWLQRGKAHALDLTDRPLSVPVRWVVYLVCLFSVLLMSHTGTFRFIYFQY